MVSRLRAGRVLAATGVLDEIISDNLGWVPYTQLANLTGRPAVSVPLSTGPPTVCRSGCSSSAGSGPMATCFGWRPAQLEEAQPWVQRHPAPAARSDGGRRLTGGSAPRGGPRPACRRAGPRRRGARTSSRTMASPRPLPPSSRSRASSRRVNRSNTRSRSASGIPGLVVVHGDEHSVGRRSRAFDLHRRTRVPDRVVDQVDQGPAQVVGRAAGGSPSATPPVPTGPAPPRSVPLRPPPAHAPAPRRGPR